MQRTQKMPQGGAGEGMFVKMQRTARPRPKPKRPGILLQ
jgi:hypothetical protein